MNEFVERSPGGKLFHSCEHPPFSILRCITTLRLLAGVRETGNTYTMNNSENRRLSFEDIFLRTLDTHTKNVPTLV